MKKFVGDFLLQNISGVRKNLVGSAAVLRDKNYTVVGEDFLTFQTADAVQQNNNESAVS